VDGVQLTIFFCPPWSTFEEDFCRSLTFIAFKFQVVLTWTLEELQRL